MQFFLSILSLAYWWSSPCPYSLCFTYHIVDRENTHFTTQFTLPPITIYAFDHANNITLLESQFALLCWCEIIKSTHSRNLGSWFLCRFGLESKKDRLTNDSTLHHFPYQIHTYLGCICFGSLCCWWCLGSSCRWLKYIEAWDLLFSCHVNTHTHLLCRWIGFRIRIKKEQVRVEVLLLPFAYPFQSMVCHALVIIVGMEMPIILPGYILF